MAEKVSRDRGYRSDTIAISRDMGPLRKSLEHYAEAVPEFQGDVILKFWEY